MKRSFKTGIVRVTVRWSGGDDDVIEVHRRDARGNWRISDRFAGTSDDAVKAGLVAAVSFASGEDPDQLQVVAGS